MNIIDIVIIIVILFGALIGFKRGFTKQLVSFLGTILIVILSFSLKTPVANFLFDHLPFFNFNGIFKGVTVLNILVYEILAFLIVLAILLTVLRVALIATGIFEKILNMTIILGIPSKILGAILGVIEHIIYVFIVLYIISLPLFNVTAIKDSKLKDKILSSVPFLSGYVDKTIEVGNDFKGLVDKYKNDTDPNSFNLEALNVLLKNKIVAVKTVDRLVASNKLQIDNVESVIKNYR